MLYDTQEYIIKIKFFTIIGLVLIRTRDLLNSTEVVSGQYYSGAASFL